MVTWFPCNPVTNSMKDSTAKYFKQPIVYVWAIIKTEKGILFVHTTNRQKHPVWSLPGGRVGCRESLTYALVNRVFDQIRLQIAPEEEIARQHAPNGREEVVYVAQYIEGIPTVTKHITGLFASGIIEDIKKLRLPKVQQNAVQNYLS